MPLPVVLHVHQQRAAADLAILDILLVFSAAGVERDFIVLAAVWTRDHLFRFGSPIADRKLIFDILFGPFLFFALGHREKLVGGLSPRKCPPDVKHTRPRQGTALVTHVTKPVVAQ